MVGRVHVSQITVHTGNAGLTEEWLMQQPTSDPTNSEIGGPPKATKLDTGNEERVGLSSRLRRKEEDSNGLWAVHSRQIHVHVS